MGGGEFKHLEKVCRAASPKPSSHTKAIIPAFIAYGVCRALD